MWERQLLVHRTDVDDLPWPTSLAEMTHHGLRYEKHAFQVDVKDSVKILFCHVPKLGPFLEPSVIDKDVDSAESRRGFFNESLSVGNLSDIRLKSSSTPIRGRDAGHDFIRSLLVFPIADRHVGAFLRQAFRDRSTNSLVAAGDGGYLARKPI
jgi:hypothetical protein